MFLSLFWTVVCRKIFKIFWFVFFVLYLLYYATVTYGIFIKVVCKNVLHAADSTSEVHIQEKRDIWHCSTNFYRLLFINHFWSGNFKNGRKSISLFVEGSTVVNMSGAKWFTHQQAATSLKKIILKILPAFSSVFTNVQKKVCVRYKQTVFATQYK